MWGNLAQPGIQPGIGLACLVIQIQRQANQKFAIANLVASSIPEMNAGENVRFADA